MDQQIDRETLARLVAERRREHEIARRRLARRREHLEYAAQLSERIVERAVQRLRDAT